MQSRAPVLLIPGLMASDIAMQPLRRMLRRRGHPTVAARIGFNVGCTTDLVERLEERLQAAREHYGRPAMVIGWSRGGCLGKIVAVRKPHLVSALITLGSPNVDPLAVSNGVRLQLRVLNRLSLFAGKRFLGADCMSGECADTMRAALLSRFPAHIPYIAFYSKTDGVVDWRACCDPDAELTEVRASHMQLGINSRVLRLVMERVDTLDSKIARSAAS